MSGVEDSHEEWSYDPSDTCRGSIHPHNSSRVLRWCLWELWCESRVKRPHTKREEDTDKKHSYPKRIDNIERHTDNENSEPREKHPNFCKNSTNILDQKTLINDSGYPDHSETVSYHIWTKSKPICSILCRTWLYDWKSYRCKKRKCE